MINDDLLTTIKSEVAGLLGWDFKSTRALDLVRGLRSMAIDSGVSIANEKTFLEWLENIRWDHQHIDMLAKYLTVGETYFFREKAHIDFFQKQLLPEFISRSKSGLTTLNIWSAGCCTGEEPYTLAMIIRETIRDADQLSIRIFASDVNKEFLIKARRGIYTSWSFRETSADLKDKYFIKHGNKYEIVHFLKNMVTFGYMNLANDDFSGFPADVIPFNLIFCRNVLMYFTPDQIRKVTSKFSSCLSSDGYLIPGIVEVNDDNFPDFKPIQLGSCTIYYKGFSTSQRLENQLVDKSTFKLNTSSITVRQPLKERHIKSAANKAKPKPLQLPVVQKELHVVQTDPRGLLAAGEYEKCITQCLEKLKNDENNPELITLLVKAYANTGNLMESIEWGNRLVQLSTCRDSHYYLVAQIMYESGNNESTLQILKKALYLNPHHLFSHYLTGLVLQRLGKNETAQKHFRNALDLLEKHQDEDILVDAEGLTAGRIKQLIINVKNNG